MGQAGDMAISLPLPVRVAAGLLATGIDVVRSLPEEIPAIPVALVGNAMRLSMKVQQEIATLATRGDELLGGVVGAPQENPSWAKFDDDEPPSKPNLKAAPDSGRSEPASTKPPAAGKKPKSDSTSRSKSAAAGSAPTDKTEVSTATAAGTEDSADELTTPSETSVAPITTIAMDAAIEVSEAVVEEVIGSDNGHADLSSSSSAADDGDPGLSDAVLDTGTSVNGVDPTPIEDVTTDVVAPEDVVSQATGTSAADDDDESEEPTASDEADDDDPPVLPGYQRMTLAQVRGHLRELSVEEVTALLQYEQSADNRAPFLTLLSNRLVTLDAQPS
jgi:hypothetical protein